MKFFSLIIFFMVLAQGAYGSDMRFVSVDFPPYTYQSTTDGAGAGAMYEVVMEISKRLGKAAKIEFIPWARARFEAENETNVAIMPLARTPEREEKYTWLIHILDDPYVLVALKNSKYDITNVNVSKNLKVGILATSVADTMLRNLGFTNIEPVSSDIQNVRKLKMGRIDAWVAPYSCRGRYNADGGLEASEVRTGAELTMLHEYLGASKKLDPQTIKLWRQTFATMKKDGSYTFIMKKYGFKPLP